MLWFLALPLKISTFLRTSYRTYNSYGFICQEFLSFRVLRIGFNSSNSCRVLTIHGIFFIPLVAATCNGEIPERPRTSTRGHERVSRCTIGSLGDYRPLGGKGTGYCQ